MRRLLGRCTPNTFAAGIAAGIVLCASVLLFFHVGSEPFQDFDESTYAEISHELLTSGDQVHLTYNATPYLRKPPLGFWLMAATQQVVHDVEFADRFPSAAAALLIIAATMLLLYETAGTPAALIGGAALTTTSAFIEAARQVRFDTLITLFLVLATYAALRASRDSRWLMAFGIFLGLGILAKGVIVLFALIPLFTVLLFERKGEWFKSSHAWVGVLFLALIALPWHIAQTIAYGGSFWHEYVGNQVVARVGTALFGDTLTNVDYLTYLASFAAPWIFVALLAVGASALHLKRFTPRERLVLICAYATLCTLILVFGTTKTKAVTYLVPLYPFITLIIGIVGGAAYTHVQKRFRPKYLAVVALAVALGAALTVFNGFHLNRAWYGAQLNQAKDEYAIGQIIRSRAGETLYAYHTDALGSIKFYTQNLTIYDVLDLHALADPGALVIVPTDALSAIPGETLYRGSQMSLMQLASQ